MKETVSIFWFRRDLCLSDNTGLYFALKENENVLPIFIFDTEILNKLENKQDRRVDFIHKALSEMDVLLRSKGSGLKTFYDSPIQAFTTLFKNYKIKNIYANHDYEPYARKRDEAIRELAESKGISFKTFKNQCIFEKDEVCKDDGKPYTIFTPYSRKWKGLLKEEHVKKYNSEKYHHNFYKYEAKAIHTLNSIGFHPTAIVFNSKPPLSKSLLLKYKEQRDFPAIAGTSRLSMHLRFGIVSVRTLVAHAQQHSETWLNELIWREFYMSILWHFPHCEKSAFKKQYDAVQWRVDEDGFKRWCEGKTGFPIVDAGMRELNATGFMHNRVRMIVSSFLVKDLLIDWRWGEAYFAEKLNDFDLSANNGGWQWAAGCGCDAAPYFRIFNPTEQQKRFDPEFKYIKKWVPEFGTDKYPAPMIDHAMARKRTLEVYKKALNNVKQGELF